MFVFNNNQLISMNVVKIVTKIIWDGKTLDEKNIPMQFTLACNDGILLPKLFWPTVRKKMF